MAYIKYLSEMKNSKHPNYNFQMTFNHQKS